MCATDGQTLFLLLAKFVFLIRHRKIVPVRRGPDLKSRWPFNISNALANQNYNFDQTENDRDFFRKSVIFGLELKPGIQILILHRVWNIERPPRFRTRATADGNDLTIIR